MRTEEKLNTAQERMRQELKEAVKKWSATEFLGGLRDEYQIRQMALLLENQRLMRECSANAELFDSQLIYDIYKDFLGFDLVSIQTMLGPVGVVFHYAGVVSHYADDRLVSTEITAKTRKLKTVMRKENKNFATDVRNEITREILCDLRNNCGNVRYVNIPTAGTFPPVEQMVDELHRTFDIIKKNAICPTDDGFWIVTTPEIAKALTSYFHLPPNEKSLDIDFYGLFEDKGIKCKIIADIFFPHQILVGYYKHLYSGYAYCPYVPLTAIPLTWAENTHQGVLTRYSKHLVNANYYAKIAFTTAYVAPDCGFITPFAKKIRNGEIAVEEDVQQSLDLAWGLIANASGGDWSKQTPEWQAAAARWRDNFYYKG